MSEPHEKSRGPRLAWIVVALFVLLALGTFFYRNTLPLDPAALSRAEAPRMGVDLEGFFLERVQTRHDILRRTLDVTWTSADRRFVRFVFQQNPWFGPWSLQELAQGREADGTPRPERR